jgi:peptidyl-tRNA hydrolase, PTH1 family
MGLFHRREQPQVETFYTVSVGANQRKLIVGLGNPGKKYDNTRHNIGFACIDSFFALLENKQWIEKKALKSLIAEVRLQQYRLIVIKPQTFMNLSGEAVKAAQHYYKIDNANTIVVHDELDIPFGQIRTRKGGSSAGHNGIKSLVQHIGEDFGRIRIGIKNSSLRTLDPADFVLQKFTEDEMKNMKALITEVTALLNEAIFGDLPTDTRSFI